jgi:hypothetical protein
MELGDIHRSYEALCAAWLKFDALCACLIARATRRIEQKLDAVEIPFVRVRTPNAVQ